MGDSAVVPINERAQVAQVGYDAGAIMEQVIATGDLSKLTPAERTRYYMARCESMGLNPLTEPLLYVSLNGKLQLYAGKNCAEQIRGLRKISVKIVAREVIDGCYVVTAAAKTPDGQCDESTGVVDLGRLSGEARANAMMKAETKAKRRVTLSICGMGLLDETEVASIPAARMVAVDTNTGEIMDAEFEQPAATPAPVQPKAIGKSDQAAVRKVRALMKQLDEATHKDDILACGRELDSALGEMIDQGLIRSGGETETDADACIQRAKERLSLLAREAMEAAEGDAS